MTERPIIFGGPMVRAILAGRKTVTRRVVKLPKWADSSQGIEVEQLHGDGPPWPVAISRETGCPVDLDCPYGQPGDRLWVRETFAVHGCAADRVYAHGEGHQWGSPIYRATFRGGLEPACEGFSKWKPSTHMPRWASRIALEVMSVRVERLQEISEADAEAEGVVPQDRYIEPPVCETTHASYRLGFQMLWDSINGQDASVVVESLGAAG